MRVSQKPGIIGGLIAGLVVGSTVGLMLAPNTGKETRRIVGTNAARMQQRAGKYINQIRAKLDRDRDLEAVGPAINHH